MKENDFKNRFPSEEEFKTQYLGSFGRTQGRTVIWYENIIERINSKLEFCIVTCSNRNAKEIIEELNKNYGIKPKYSIKENIITFNKA